MTFGGVASLDALQAGDPQRVGPYMLLGRLGGGVMGRVYLARSPGGRMVAVKIIRADLAEDPGFRARFAREVSAAREVSGLFTSTLVDADIDGQVLWLATAYVPGMPLSDAVERRGPLPESSVPALAAGLAEGLSAIHAAGVIHGDLEPSNVLLAQDGPRIIDFGISSAASATALTGTGFITDSPGFMSPERIAGLTVGPASDIFSLAAVLIYAARGEGPFGGGDSAALLYRALYGEPDMNGVPDKLRPLIRRSLSKDPNCRPSATEFLADLSAAYPSADLTNWLPARILDPSAAGAAPTEASLDPSAADAAQTAASLGPSVTASGPAADGSAAAAYAPPQPGRAAPKGSRRSRRRSGRQHSGPEQADDEYVRAVRTKVRPGMVAFNPPSEMIQGRKERVEVGIARSPELRQALAAGFRGRGEPQFEGVDTSSFMGVELKGYSFEITPFSPLEQLVAPLARWEFDVKPYRAGQQTLTLCISLRIDTINSEPASGGRIAIPVLERDIRIRVDLSYSARRFLSNNWQWLIVTILGLGSGLVAWIALFH
jgi:serine/threonine protein kinase